MMNADAMIMIADAETTSLGRTKGVVRTIVQYEVLVEEHV